MKKIYNSKLTIENPIIKDHFVHGQTLLPGLAYIDMIYQLTQEAMGLDFKKHKLKRLSISNPLIVKENQAVDLRISFERMIGYWQIEVKGTEVDHQHKPLNEKLYITAELQEEMADFQEQINVETIKAAAVKCANMEEVYSRAERNGLVHQGMIRAKGNIYIIDSGCLVELNVGEAYRNEGKNFLVHPALIDGAAMAAGILVSVGNPNQEEEMYLPLYYEEFSCSHPLYTHCYARVNLASFQTINDIRSMDIEFFDAEGKQIGKLKGITTKRVRYKGQINAALAQEFTMENHSENVSHEVEKASHIEGLLQKIFSKHINKSINRSDFNSGFYELGLQSSQLLAVVRDLENTFKTSLNPTLLFEYTSISDLTSYFSKNSDLNLESPNKTDQEKPINATDYTSQSQEGFAIIGMAGRLPGAANIEEFWQNLKEGKDCITEIPSSRWNWRHYEKLKSPSGKNISKWGGFIDDPDCFDAQFFRISPREAEMMDPQERLFLETCWEAIEDAGYTPKTVVEHQGINKKRPVGVFVGVMHKDYALVGAEALAQGQVFPLSLNNAPIANRVSYFCNFHGPSMAIDTACSSSLTAVHQAIESIRNGECQVALAGGVNLSLNPNKYLSYGLMDMHSSDGYCHTFGKGGDGYVTGEGVGVVLIKPLQKAMKDKDHIYAVIKGSTINHVGAVSGITVPSPVAQGEVITACLEKAGINPRTIGYVEAHGTGTSLGDPIEIQGLVKAYRQYTQDLQFCSIGSVKSNIGHAESAAGISGLIKTVLQLYHRTLVPSLHSEEENPHIDFKTTPFYIQNHIAKWKQQVMIQAGKQVSCPRRAGVSAFGASGSNAHILLEEYTPREVKQHVLTGAANEVKPVIIPISAKDEERLRAYAVKLLKFLRSNNWNKSYWEDEEHKKIRLHEILSNKLRRILSEVLHTEEGQIDADQEWNEYGIGLVQIMQIKEKIQEEFDIEAHIEELIPTMSIASVVTQLTDEHKALLENYSLSTLQETTKMEEICFHSKNVDIRELAYTLQVGRQGMEERIAFVVEDIHQLIEKLEVYLAGKNIIDNHCQGHIKHDKEAVDLFNADKHSKEIIYQWISSGNVEKLAQLWVKGYELDWGLLYGEVKPDRISLPTYPFAKERYWIPNTRHQSPQEGKTNKYYIHPLIHENTSDFYQQCFSSIFSGEEFFLTDHVVMGQRVLPGVAYLEMVRTAVEQAAGTLVNEATLIQLKNVVWLRPVIVELEPLQVHISLYANVNGEISFEIFSGTKETDDGYTVHSQGTVVLSSIAEKPVLDINHLQTQCKEGCISASQCYEAFEKMGINYGPGYRGVKSIYVGEDQMLASLALPSSVLDSKEEFVLHPSLLDSALHSSLGLTLDLDDLKSSESMEVHKPSLPFALEELEIFSDCTSEMWALVKYSKGSSLSDSVRKMDIYLCHQDGNVAVRMKGFSTRVFEVEVNKSKEATVQTTGIPKEPPIGDIMLMPVWDRVAIEYNNNLPSYEDQIIVVGANQDNIKALKQKYPNTYALNIDPEDTVEAISQKLIQFSFINHIIWIAPSDSVDSLISDALINDQYKGVLQLLRLIKALLHLNYGSREMSWSIITTQTQYIDENSSVNPTHASIHGIVGSMTKEYPNWKTRLIDVEEGYSWPLNSIFTIPTDPQGHALVNREGQWYKQHLIPFYCSHSKESLYKHSGVYIVIGGAGHIGEVWSEYMLRTYSAQIIWIGRSQKNASIQSKLNRLSNYGPAPQYITADASNLMDLQRAYKEIKEKYPLINGIVNSAMFFSQFSLENIEEEEFKAGLSAKVDVCVRMAQVFKDESLDFVMFFSSLIAQIKNAKQSHYASGCTFGDAFAHKLSKSWSCAVKVMNWGFWNSQQATSDENFVQLMEQIGLGFIEPEAGMKALEVLLSAPIKQIALIKTTKSIPVEGMKQGEAITVYPKSFSLNPEASDGIVRQEVIAHKSPAKEIKEQHNTPKLFAVSAEKGDISILKEKSINYIKNVVGEVLKMPGNKLDSSEPLDKYGIDSIMAVQMTNILRESIENVSSTIFFENQTIDQLVEYLILNEQDSLIKLLGIETQNSNEKSSQRWGGFPMSTAKASSSSLQRAGRFVQPKEDKTQESAASCEDIAIIGLTGRYPEAENLQTFWENLKSGKDSIIEIPKERWDHSLYFEEDKGAIGKTCCKWGGFLEGIDKFDPLFFNISPREAENMVPQERLFLEAVWNLLESSGYTREALQSTYESKVGVYIGALQEQDYSISYFNSIANKVSYFFNFQGPSIVVDTACSSSAIAIHMACESLIKGECELAIAGGVNLLISPKKYQVLSLSNMLGSNINCRSFSDSDGMIPAEAVGAVLLKPLSKAVKAGDSILAVIKSTATNHGGHTNGFSVGNPNVQAKLMEDNFNKSGIDPRTISYVEAAANGLAIGDSIEITALKKAFDKFTKDKQFCAIGAVKSGMGHAEAASGISQLTKVILQLQNGQLAPTVKAEPLNPNINFNDTPFYLQSELQAWDRPIIEIDGVQREFPRRAAINSFGGGGAYAHIIVEEYIASQEEAVDTYLSDSPQVIVFSAKNKKGLLRVLEQMLQFVELQNEINLASLAYTLQVGREAMEFRLAIVVNSKEELIQGIEEYLKSSISGKDVSGADIFTGNLEDNSSDIRDLFMGETGESIMQLFLAEKNLHKLALCWVKGCKVPWELLYDGKAISLLELPTYPFEKRKCWIETKLPAVLAIENPVEMESVSNKNYITDGKSISDRVVSIISELLGMESDEIKLSTALKNYGFDSIILMRLVNQLQTKIDPLVGLDELLKCTTIQDIINILSSSTQGETSVQKQVIREAVSNSWSQFPELIRLNQGSKGMPVFWFHPVQCGVELYPKIAQKSERPFYGIQARGWMTERTPLQGIHAMAAYYVQIVQSVQPKGPYDLGGYSLGGVLAYEVTRQLQELGEKVNTIVMLDSPDSTKLRNMKISRKSGILQGINMALQSNITNNPEKIYQTLIHRDMTDLSLDNESFVKEAMELAKKRGSAKSEAQLKRRVLQSTSIQQAYRVNIFSALPLPDPDSVSCYYFRNKSELFYGELEPYFTVDSSENDLNHVDYWGEWQSLLPHFSLMDLDCSNHFMLLSEEKSYAPVIEFIEKLYSHKGMTNEFYEPFFNEHRSQVISKNY